MGIESQPGSQDQTPRPAQDEMGFAEFRAELAANRPQPVDMSAVNALVKTFKWPFFATIASYGEQFLLHAPKIMIATTNAVGVAAAVTVGAIETIRLRESTSARRSGPEATSPTNQTPQQ